MNSLIAIIILHFGKKELTRECLYSLKKILVPKGCYLKIIVVDNGTNSGDYFKKFRNITVVENKDNLGWAGGNNSGIRYALNQKAEYILLLNNDLIVTSNFLVHLLEILNTDKTIGIVGPKTYYIDKKKTIADCGGILMRHRYFGINRGQSEKDKGQYENVTDVDFISGSAFLVKASLYKKLGLFDERLFLYYEDTDFCQRAKKAGYRSVIVPQAVVYHKFGATSKIGSPLHNYYTTRNHYLFVEKNAPLIVKLREFLRTPKTVWEFFISKDQIRKKYSLLGIRDYYIRRFGKRTYW